MGTIGDLGDNETRELEQGGSQEPTLEVAVSDIVAAAAAPALKVVQRVYYSSYHLWAAQHFSDLAGAIETAHSGPPRFDIEHRAYVTSAVFSAVAFMEAAINELFQDASDGHHAYIDPLDSSTQSLMATYWELTDEGTRAALGILDRYQLLLNFARKESFPKGELPYQDAALLVELRNRLVHYKPEDVSGSDVHRLQKKLTGKFPLNALMEGSSNPFFPDKGLGHGCAQWAVVSSKSFLDEFHARIEVTPNYQRVDFDRTASEPGDA